MANQTAANVLVAIKRETTTGTAATATGATQLRITDSPGMEFSRAQIQSNEKRSDGFMTMGRLGTKSAQGSYNAEVSVGGATDIFLEAVMRSTWATSTAITFASVTSITTGTNEVVGSGDWVSAGIRVGDIFRLSNHSTTANNDKNLQVTAVSSGTISVPAGSLTADATADSTGTLTILKKLKAGTTPTRYSHTVEQYDRDIDMSQLFLGCRVTGVTISMQPDANVTATYTLMGLDHTILDSASSPWFSNPSLTTGLGLVTADAKILKDGVEVTTFTGLELQFQITAAGQPVIGADVSPDIFDNDCQISGTLSGIRSDLTRLTAYDAETEFEIFVKLEEPASSGAKPCLAFYIPRVKIGQLSAPVGGGDGAKVETLQLMIGPRDSADGYDATPITISSSAS